MGCGTVISSYRLDTSRGQIRSVTTIYLRTSVSCLAWYTAIITRTDELFGQRTALNLASVLGEVTNP